jgi:peptide/nickel transport system substrate-binding protein
MLGSPRTGVGPTVRRVVVVALAAAAAVVAGCGSTGSATRNDSGTTIGTTLRTALSFDPGSLDPDIFYGNEGLLVTTSCYDGLLAYQNNTTKIVPALAESYTVSNGGKRYTFKLRSGVRFADGSPFNAKAMQFSIERRRKVDAGPAYMVAPIKRTSAPDDLTLVVDLSTPINPFPSWLASPYGLKAVSPTAVDAHERKGDSGKAWLATHCAGTGPYDLTDVTEGQRYELTANKYYWGEKPQFSRVLLNLIPSFSTQALQLEKGQLDMMTHGLTLADVKRFKGKPTFSVSELPGISAVNLWMNPNKAALKDPDARRAASMAIDRKTLVQQVYGDTATVYDDVFAPGTLPAGNGFDLAYDPAAAKAIMDKVPASRRSISLQFTSDDATNQQIAGLLAQQLEAVGFKVTQRGLPETEVFNFTTAPESRRPSMIVLPQNPDDASPSSFPQLQWLSGQDAGGFFPPYDPGADVIFKRAVREGDPDQAQALYIEAAKRYAKTYAMVPIANTKAVVVARRGITRVAVERQGLWTVDFSALRRGTTASGTQG